MVGIFLLASCSLFSSPGLIGSALPIVDKLVLSADWLIISLSVKSLIAVGFSDFIVLSEIFGAVFGLRSVFWDKVEDDGCAFGGSSVDIGGTGMVWREEVGSFLGEVVCCLGEAWGCRGEAWGCRGEADLWGNNDLGGGDFCGLEAGLGTLLANGGWLRLGFVSAIPASFFTPDEEGLPSDGWWTEKKGLV